METSFLLLLILIPRLLLKCLLDYWIFFSSDGGEDESEDYLDDILFQSMEMDPCTSTIELR